MSWKNYLKPVEAKELNRLEKIEIQAREARRQANKIYDRCRKRMKKEEAKQ